MAKMSREKRSMIQDWLESVVQELVDANVADKGKYGHPALRELLDFYGGVTSYEISSAMFLQNVQISYRGFYVDTHDGGWVGFYCNGYSESEGRYIHEDEMVKMPLPREHAASIGNAIKLFASEQWKDAVEKYGTNV